MPSSSEAPDATLPEPTGKRRRFADEYLIDLNATRAYRAAGYKASTDNTAGVEGSKLLRDPKVGAYVKARTKAAVEKAGITADRALQELGRLATSDIRKLFDKDGKLLPVHLLPDDVAAAISSVEVVTNVLPGVVVGADGIVNPEAAPVEHVHKIKFWNKNDALNSVGRHHKLFTDVVEVKGDLAGKIQAARQRLKQRSGAAK